MFVVDSACMRQMDEAVIAAGTPGRVLMDRAGRGGARCLLERPDWLWGTTLVVCGKGNNGGDGLVIARVLHQRGHPVHAALTSPADQLSPDAAFHHAAAVEAGVPLHDWSEDPVARLGEWVSSHPGRSVIDGLLGTGFTPPCLLYTSDAADE